jgi:hypothetical protein
VQQGTRFVATIVLRRESHPRVDAIGGPGTRVYDGIAGQCDRMGYRRLMQTSVTVLSGYIWGVQGKVAFRNKNKTI